MESGAAALMAFIPRSQSQWAAPPPRSAPGASGAAQAGGGHGEGLGLTAGPASAPDGGMAKAPPAPWQTAAERDPTLNPRQPSQHAEDGLGWDAGAAARMGPGSGAGVPGLGSPDPTPTPPRSPLPLRLGLSVALAASAGAGDGSTGGSGRATSVDVGMEGEERLAGNLGVDPGLVGGGPEAPAVAAEDTGQPLVLVTDKSPMAGAHPPDPAGFCPDRATGKRKRVVAGWSVPGCYRVAQNALAASQLGFMQVPAGVSYQLMGVT